MPEPSPTRVIVAMTGASGAPLGVRALERLRALKVETHLVISAAAALTLAHETDRGLAEVQALAHASYDPRQIGATIASGSFPVHGMIVIPCSIKTLSAIANSYADDLIVRAADVCLKERRRVVLLLRETPLHAGHIDLMARVTRAGAIVMPPVPAFYHRPKSIDDIVDQTVGRALDAFDLDLGLFPRWAGIHAGRTTD